MACRQQDVDTLVIVGGVAANSRIRALAEERCAAAGIELRVPPMRLCTDNGAMIAAIGDLLVRDGAKPSAPDFSAIPTVELSSPSSGCEAADGDVGGPRRAGPGRRTAGMGPHATPPPEADVYRSADQRVVVIDRTGAGLPEVPPELVDRPPHAWPFEPVAR